MDSLQPYLKNVTLIMLWDHYKCKWFSNLLLILRFCLHYSHGDASIKVSPRNFNYTELNGAIYDVSRTTLFHCPVNATFCDIHKDVKNIDPGAFFDCKKLRLVTIPTGIELIPHNIFCDCESLENEIIFKHRLYCVPKSATDYEIPQDVKEIDYGAFKHCNKLRHVTLPPGIEDLPSLTFYNCNLLEDEIIFERTLLFMPKTVTDYVIPDDVQAIDSMAFDNCLALKHVTIPGSIQVIINGTFSHCKALRSVTIEEGVKTIKYAAFRDCGLTDVVLPASLRTIDDAAFFQCPLRVLTFKGKNPPIVTDGPFNLENLQLGCAIRVPMGSKEAYEKIFPQHTVVEYNIWN